MIRIAFGGSLHRSSQVKGPLAILRFAITPKFEIDIGSQSSPTVHTVHLVLSVFILSTLRYAFTLRLNPL